jgi:hypothetical protein
VRSATKRSDQRRLQLLAELSNYGDTAALNTYQHMFNRVQALYQTATDNRTTLTRDDVDKLEDLTVDYLGLCAVNLSLKQRKDHANDDVAAKRIAGIQRSCKTRGCQKTNSASCAAPWPNTPRSCTAPAAWPCAAVRWRPP